ncbi:hypothetical protein RIF29_28612 [Crotalaria pallida]|uniref:Transmembrane protein n=1 Tax=Crotalaria pallida TaxID=3830 RepID=A0AAN9EDG1_CROPI
MKTNTLKKKKKTLLRLGGGCCGCCGWVVVGCWESGYGGWVFGEEEEERAMELLVGIATRVRIRERWRPTTMALGASWLKSLALGHAFERRGMRIVVVVCLCGVVKWRFGREGQLREMIKHKSEERDDDNQATSGRSRILWG